MPLNEKIILDAACGSKMFWFNKENPLAIFADIRRENHTLCDGRALEINPDLQIDFRKMPFRDNHFKLVVFDPPHIDNLGKSSFMALKYGRLEYNWKNDLTEGFNECMRVLQPYGILVFKWNEARVKLNEVLKLFPIEPLFGHVTGKHGRTIWLCFMKLPSSTASIIF